MIVVALLYFVVALWLSCYSLNALLLALLAWRVGHRPPSPRPPTPERWPAVLVQLPIYNEKYVATRLIDAICALDYPAERLSIQLLDDSTDETVRLVACRVQRWRKRGFDIVHLRRPDRRDFKAGALQFGLGQSDAPFVAIFDADFVPPTDWLKRTMRHLLADEAAEIGMMQTRWGHLNRDYSPLTAAQALALDGHFGVEQRARAAGGLLLNFNGTAGIWRRACIEQAGGWRGDSLCEDLDLSYRAQLRGWRMGYDPAIVAPAEIPVQLTAFKRQQYRWAKGSMQVARLRLAALWRSPLAWWQKAQATLHLTAYIVHPLMVLLLLLTPLLLWQGWPAPLADQAALLGGTSLAGLSAPLLYALAQLRLHGARRGLRHYRAMPWLVMLGAGIALNNSRAVIEGLFGKRGGEFRRTPKFRVEGERSTWQQRDYTLPVTWDTIGELLLAAYALGACVIAIVQRQWFALPYMALYLAAFGGVAGVALWQRRAIAQRSSGRTWGRFERSNEKQSEIENYPVSTLIYKVGAKETAKK